MQKEEEGKQEEEEEAGGSRSRSLPSSFSHVVIAFFVGGRGRVDGLALSSAQVASIHEHTHAFRTSSFALWTYLLGFLSFRSSIHVRLRSLWALRILFVVTFLIHAFSIFTIFSLICFALGGREREREGGRVNQSRRDEMVWCPISWAGESSGKEESKRELA